MIPYFNTKRTSWVVILVFLLVASCTFGGNSPSTICNANDQSECENNPITVYNATAQGG